VEDGDGDCGGDDADGGYGDGDDVNCDDGVDVSDVYVVDDGCGSC